jgi:hypothetical protein
VVTKKREHKLIVKNKFDTNLRVSHRNSNRRKHNHRPVFSVDYFEVDFGLVMEKVMDYFEVVLERERFVVDCSGMVLHCNHYNHHNHLLGLECLLEFLHHYVEVERNLVMV